MESLVPSAIHASDVLAGMAIKPNIADQLSVETGVRKQLPTTATSTTDAKAKPTTVDVYAPKGLVIDSTEYKTNPTRDDKHVTYIVHTHLGAVQRDFEIVVSYLKSANDRQLDGISIDVDPQYTDSSMVQPLMGDFNRQLLDLAGQELYGVQILNFEYKGLYEYKVDAQGQPVYEYEMKADKSGPELDALGHPVFKLD